MKLINEKPFILLIVLLIFCFSLQLIKYHEIGNLITCDGLGYYAHLRSLFIDGDLHYANEFRDYNPLLHGVPNPETITCTKHVHNKYTIGLPLLWLPFFLLAHIFTILLNLFGLNIPLNGYSVLYHFFISFGSIFYGLIGLTLIYRILMKFFNRSVSLITVSAITLGTNIIYYIGSDTTMSHAISLFTVTWFIYLWLNNRNNYTVKYMIISGFSTGIMSLVRLQNILFLILPVIDLFIELIQSKSFPQNLIWKRFIRICVFIFTFLLVLLPQFVVWKILYGKFVLYSYQGEGFNFLHPQIYNSLLSPLHGLIYWNPVILISLIGLVLFIKKQRKTGFMFAIAFLLQLYLNASWSFWSFGSSFGNRGFVNCSFVFAIGLAMLLSVLKRSSSIILYITLTLLVFWNLIFMLQYSAGMISYNEPVYFHQVFNNLTNLLKFIFNLF
jgi:hypothetical protein